MYFVIGGPHTAPKSTFDPLTRMECGESIRIGMISLTFDHRFITTRLEPRSFCGLSEVNRSLFRCEA